MSTVQLVNLLDLFSEKHEQLLRCARTEPVPKPLSEDAISHENRLQFLN